MTTRVTELTQERKTLERFPDYPPRDDMQNWLHLYEPTIAQALSFHFGDRPDVIVGCEFPVGPSLSVRSDVRIPDLSVMIGGNRQLLLEQWGYEIARQGKAPDFVLEVASKSTGVMDYTKKRADYERYGVREYWRYDPSGGEYHDAALAADRLVDGKYEPLEIEWLDADKGRGYSDALGLYVCWEYGELRFWDPATQDFIRTHKDDNERARRAEAEARRAETRATAEAHRAEAEAYRAAEEAEARREAERRSAELEAELRRLRGE